MTSRAQRADRWPRPPLLAALLPGIAILRALGHPTDSHALEDVPAAHSVASAGRPGTPPDGEPRHAAPAGSRDTAPLGGAVRIPARSF